MKEASRVAKSRKKKPAPGGDLGPAGRVGASGPDEDAAGKAVAGDEAALSGWWARGRIEKLLLIDAGRGYLKVYDLGADRNWVAWRDFDLEARGGARLLVELHGERLETRNPLFEYRLRGDRLELEKLP